MSSYRPLRIKAVNSNNNQNQNNNYQPPPKPTSSQFKQQQQQHTAGKLPVVVRQCIVHSPATVGNGVKSGDSGIGSGDRTTMSGNPIVGSDYLLQPQQQGSRANVGVASRHQPQQYQMHKDDDEDLDNNIWGDDDDDLFIQASQVAEAQNAELEKKKPVPHPAPPTAGAPLSTEMLRYQLALKENDGADIMADAFMKKGVLGGEIKQGITGVPLDDKEKMSELEKINAQLKADNYTCRGEISVLRRRLATETEQKQKSILKRQELDKERKNKEDEARKKIVKDFEAARTELRYSKNEVQSLTDQLQSLQRKLATCGSFQSGTGSMGKLGGPSSRFPTLDQFKAKEVPIPKRKLLSTEIQTDVSEPPETENDLRRKIWKDREEGKQEILTVLLENISLKINKEYKELFPRLRLIAQNAQHVIIQSLRLKGFPYDCGFPENLKLAEYKLDEKDRVRREGLTPVTVLPNFPSKLSDWEGTKDVEQGIQDQLRFHRDVWRVLCNVLTELSKRIDCVKEERNCLYKENNLAYFMRLLIWAHNLWENFIPEMCESWTGKSDPRTSYKSEIRQWATIILWIGSRYFIVKAAQVETRKLAIKVLDKMTQQKYFIYNQTYYQRLHLIIWDTLTVDRHLDFDNLYRCIHIARSMNRKQFYLKFMCMHNDTGQCLARQFGEKTLMLFKKKKRNSMKRFRLYAAYVGLLMELRDCCIIHTTGECSDSKEEEDPEEPEAPKKKRTRRATFRRPKGRAPKALRMATGNSSRVVGFDGTVNSFYGPDEIVVVELDDDDEGLISGSQGYVVSLPVKALESPAAEKMDVQRVTVNNSTNPRSSGSAVTLEDDVVNLSLNGENSSEETMMEVEEAATSSQHQNNVEGVSESSNNESQQCRKFLDCSLWEVDKKDVNKDLCQCRCFLVETFMIMTEEMLEFWRYIKSLNDFEESKMGPEEVEETYKRANDLDKLIKRLRKEEREKERQAGVVKTDQDFEIDKLASADHIEYAQQMRRDNEFCFQQNTVQAKDVQEVKEALETAVELMYDSFMTSVNIIYAFGQEGASAFSATCALLLYHLEELNFIDSTEDMVKYLTYESDVMRNADGNHMDDQSSVVDAETQYVDEKCPKFTMDNEQIKKAVPGFLVKKIQKFQEWKSAAKLLPSDPEEEREGKGRIADKEVEVVEKFEARMKKVWEESLSGVVEVEENTGKTSNVPQEGTEMECDPQVVDNEERGEIDLSNEDDYEFSSESSHLSLPTGDSGNSEDENNDCDEWDDVEDYEKFCRSGQLLTDDESDEEEVPKFTPAELEAIFPSAEDHGSASRVFPMTAKVKSAKEVCEELRLSGDAGVVTSEGGDAGPSSLAVQPETSTSTELDSLLQSSLVNLKFKDYYKTDNSCELWNDFNDDVVPVDI